ncbi:MAG TPA: hypothetical protein VGC99_20725 [Candidatus Tectomicrobia bacterium]
MATLAGYEAWGGGNVHIVVMTHLRCQEKSYAGVVVSKIIETVLTQGLVLQYHRLQRRVQRGTSSIS